MRSGLFGKSKRANQDFYLQITSLIDTLVIILVFMLMTIGTGSVNLEMASNIKLPWVNQGGDLPQGVKLIAKLDGLYLDEDKVLAMNDAKVPSTVTAEDGRKIVPLFQRLMTLAAESKKAAATSGVKFEGKVLLQADKQVPLKTIKQVLYTAARAGYNDFKFAVIRQ